MLARPNQRIRAISLVPLVDVLLIMLVFFMVTSTYLDLDMLPVTDASDPAAPSEAGPQPPAEAGTLFVRITADGGIIAAGQRLDLDGFGALVAERLAAGEDLRLLVLPSARAGVQALVSVMDRATLAGVTQLRIVRLEGE
jgi:biopolymer transport protein ExbD